VKIQKSDIRCILSSVGDSAQKSLDGMLTHSLYGDIFLKIIRLQNIATISSIFTKENFERSALFGRLDDWQY